MTTLRLSGKRVLLRVDLNVPMEHGKVTDATRIDRVLHTIREISEKGGKVILLAHFGRPKGGPDEANSLRPVAAAVAEHLKQPVGLRARLHWRCGQRRDRRDEGRRRSAA